MGNYSKNPQVALQDALQKGYSRVRFQQGKPILDRELNLAADLAAPNRLLRHYLGKGVPEDSAGFAIENLNPFTNDFTIRAGRCLVNGLDVVLNSDTTYKTQPHNENVKQFAQGVSLLYLRAFTVEVNETQDPDLKNAGDIGFETALRERVDWEVLFKRDALSTPDHFFLGVLVYSGAGLPPPPESEMQTSLLHTFAGQPAESDMVKKLFAQRAAKRELAEKEAEEKKSLLDKPSSEQQITPIPEEPTADFFDFRATQLTLSRVQSQLYMLLDSEHKRLANGLVLLRNLSLTVVHESSLTINGGQTATVKIASSGIVGTNPWFLVSVWGSGQFSWTERSVSGDRLLFFTNLVNNAQATVNVKALMLNF